MSKDKFHGQGGTYEVRNGERVRIDKPQETHKDGDRARGADGKPVDETLEKPKVEPALPKPQPAPWEQPAAETKSIKRGA